MQREERVSHSSDQSCGQQRRGWNQMPQAQMLCSSCSSLSKSPHLSVFPCPHEWGFPGGSEVQNPSANAGDAGDTGSIPGSGRSPEGGHGTPLQYSCLETPHGQRSLGGYSLWRPHVHNTMGVSYTCIPNILYYIHTIIYICVHMHIYTLYTYIVYTY